MSNKKKIVILYSGGLDSFIMKKLAEAKGKRVAVGAAGSGVEANARQVLEANGITYSDIKVQYLSFAEAAESSVIHSMHHMLPHNMPRSRLTFLRIPQFHIPEA